MFSHVFPIPGFLPIHAVVATVATAASFAPVTAVAVTAAVVALEASSNCRAKAWMAMLFTWWMMGTWPATSHDRPGHIWNDEKCHWWLMLLENENVFFRLWGTTWDFVFLLVYVMLHYSKHMFYAILRPPSAPVLSLSPCFLMLTVSVSGLNGMGFKQKHRIYREISGTE